MTPEEKVRLEKLDRVLSSPTVREQIAPIISRVQAKLARKIGALMTWEPIPLQIYGGGLPSEIRSSWVFVLRAGADTGAERHPNSHQRMMSIQGSGDMRTEEEGRWRSNVLISKSDAPLEQRWISIPQNMWHRPMIPKGSDWIVISFHTVPAEELMEELPNSDSASGTKRMRYLGPKNG
jgi:hypothetical protein